MSSKELAIRVEGVSKHYLIFNRPEDRLKQMIVPKMQRMVGMQPTQYYKDFAALTDINLEVPKGETLGLVGRNGSGKSTLLQIICGTLRPSKGSVKTNGKIAALLELGAGFNPEFTGRENVHVKAAILGLSRAEIEQRFDDIAAFADIGEFIEQPVKTYSSGMFMRLAFAVSVVVDPDILIVDEALAVGDEAFQRKCFSRFERIHDRGGTIIFVTHSAQSILQMCSSAALLDAGQLIMTGKPKAVISQHQKLVNLKGEDAALLRGEILEMYRNGHASEDIDDGSDLARSAMDGEFDRQSSFFDPELIAASTVNHAEQGARISNVRILNEDGESVNVLVNGADYVLQYRVEFQEDAEQAGFSMMLRTVNGTSITGVSTGQSRVNRKDEVAAGTQMDVDFAFTCSLTPGTYFANVGVSGFRDDNKIQLHRIVDAICFKVAPVDNPISMGFFDLGARPEIRLLNSADN